MKYVLLFIFLGQQALAELPTNCNVFGHRDRGLAEFVPRPILTHPSPKGSEVQRELHELTAAVDPRNGSIYVAGFYRDRSAYNYTVYNEGAFVLRVLCNGKTDQTFGVNGTVTFPDLFYHSRKIALAVQRDGKIVFVTSTSADGFLVKRLHPTGRPDTSFGSAGTARTRVGSDYALAMKLDSSGKIVVAGISIASVLGFQYRFMLARYATNGQLDTTFATGGIAINTARFPYLFSKFALEITSAGKIVIGTLAARTSRFSGSQYSMVLLRYHSNGVLDTTLGGKGTLTLEGSKIGGVSHYNFPLIRQSGALLMAMWGGLFQLLPDGRADVNFGGGGVSSLPEGSYPLLVENADRSLLVGRNVYEQNRFHLRMIRLTQTGDPDSTFGDRGDGISDSTVGGSLLTAGLFPSGGKIFQLAIDFARSGVGALVRYDNSGLLDGR